MNKHPDKTLLEAYASGSIDAVSGLVVATHLETCPKCRAYVNQLEAAQASLVNDIPSIYDAEFDSMFNDIITSEPTSDSIIVRDVAKVMVAGKDFKLPKTLSRSQTWWANGRAMGAKSTVHRLI